MKIKFLLLVMVVFVFLLTGCGKSEKKNVMQELTDSRQAGEKAEKEKTTDSVFDELKQDKDSTAAQDGTQKDPGILKKSIKKIDDAEKRAKQTVEDLEKEK